MIDVKSGEGQVTLELVRLSNFDRETTEIFEEEFISHFGKAEQVGE